MIKPQTWLWPLSIPYALAVRIRNRLYDLNALTSYAVDCPVLSVGNISVGGAGKTPFVIHLVERLGEMGLLRRFRTVVLSRGYGGSARGTMVVSDGHRILASPDTAGDEPVMTAHSLRSAAVLVDRNRLRGAKYAIEELRAGLLILDDGFQHRRLRRDLDIVLLDAANPLGRGFTLPAGFLREPASSLKRADLIVLSKAEGETAALEERCRKLEVLLGKPVLATRLQPRTWRHVAGGELFSVEQVAGRKVFAFAGIARPESFFSLVTRLGGDLMGNAAMPDHCRYNRVQIDYVSRRFFESRAEWMVTTAKDAVKLPSIMKRLPAFYLDLGMETAVGGQLLDERMRTMLKSART